MKVAHLIMAHQYPSQLERLVKRLHHPECSVFIHLDKKANIEDFEKLKLIKNVFFINTRIHCNWGGFSFVKAITNSIREILQRNEQFEYINLLSAQDYPIRPMEEFYAFLIKNRGNSFISYEELGKGDWWKHAITRFELYHFTDFNVKGRYLIQRIFNKFLSKREFPLSYNLFGSAVSSWWILNSDSARYLLGFLDTNPKLLRFMKFTWGSDEFLYATLIMNSDFKDKVINNNFRYIRWQAGKAHPQILKSKDYNDIITSSDFFARKFEENSDSEILDKLDKHIKFNTEYSNNYQ